jgi:hypothetical protein
MAIKSPTVAVFITSGARCLSITAAAPISFPGLNCVITLLRLPPRPRRRGSPARTLVIALSGALAGETAVRSRSAWHRGVRGRWDPLCVVAPLLSNHECRTLGYCPKSQHRCEYTEVGGTTKAIIRQAARWLGPRHIRRNGGRTRHGVLGSAPPHAVDIYPFSPAAVTEWNGGQTPQSH